MNLDWQNYLDMAYSSTSSKKELIVYANRLDATGLPVIFDFYHLCYIIGLSPLIVNKMLNSTNKFYREFSIPKRRGGVRIISTAYPSLQSCQKWIKKNILDTIKVHDCSYSYTKNKSIVDNANVHVNHPVLYKLDLEDFFKNIPIKRVVSVFRHCGYNHKVSYYLAKLCTLNGSLPQGACTSPQLSNIICKRLDNRLNSFAQKHRLVYSRYADDICLSGKFIGGFIRMVVNEIIQSERFQVNKLKEKLIIGNDKKKVITGLTVSPDGVKVQKAYKKELKLTIFKYLKYREGLSVDSGKFHPLFKEQLIGKLNFWKMVESNNVDYINSLIHRIAKEQELYLEEINNSLQ